MLFRSHGITPPRRVLAVAFALSWAGHAMADPLATAAEVHRLSLKESGEKVPVKLAGVVTYVRGLGPEVVIQDGTGGVMLDWTHDPANPVEVGMRVEVEGYTAIHPPTPRAIVTSSKILGREALPEPARMTVAQLLGADIDGTYVECEDVIRAVRVEEGEITPARLVLELGPAAGRLFIWVSRWDEATRRSLEPGATVRVRGVLMRWKTVHWMPVSSFVVVHQPSWITVVEPPPAFAGVPLVEIGELPAAAADDDFAERFRVRGVVAYSDAAATVITEDKEALWVRAGDGARFRPGDRVEAIGYPGNNGPRCELEDAVLVKSGEGPPGEPVVLRAEDFERREPMWMDGVRVKLRGVVTAGSSDPEESPIFLDFGGRVIPVHFADHPPAGSLPVAGSVVEITGVLEAGLNLQIRRIGRGVGDYRLHVQSPGEIGVLRAGPWWTPRRVTTAILALSSLAVAAAVWALFLNRRVAQKSKALVGEIAARREQEIVSAERRRLAGDLHDTLEQTLTGASLQLDAMEGGDPPTPLRLARTLLDRGRDELRRAVWDLTPGVLEEQGFAAALEAIAAERMDRGGVEIRREFGADLSSVPDRVASHLCRVAQEAIANAVRHGKATLIHLRVEAGPAGASLVIEDNGAGFAVEHAPGISSGHFGLNGMKERLRRLGGSFEIHSRPGEGTTVRGRCPLA